MTIGQLKRLVANLPEDAWVLLWDKDTANPVERVIAYNIEPEPVDGVEVVRGEEFCIADFDPVPAAALIFVSTE